MERIREMARSGGGTVSKATASKYSNKVPQKVAGSPAPGGSGSEGGGLVVSSEGFEKRLARIEESLAELQDLKKLVRGPTSSNRQPQLKRQPCLLSSPPSTLSTHLAFIFYCSFDHHTLLRPPLIPVVRAETAARSAILCCNLAFDYWMG